jgi:hypothetical protein
MSKAKPKPAERPAGPPNSDLTKALGEGKTADEIQKDANEYQREQDLTAARVARQKAVDDAKLEVDDLELKLKDAKARLEQAEADQAFDGHTLQNVPKCLPQYDPTLRSARDTRTAHQMSEVVRSNEPVVEHLSDPASVESAAAAQEAVQEGRSKDEDK